MASEWSICFFIIFFLKCKQYSLSWYFTHIKPTRMTPFQTTIKYYGSYSKRQMSKWLWQTWPHGHSLSGMKHQENNSPSPVSWPYSGSWNKNSLSLGWDKVKGANTNLELHYEKSYTLVAWGKRVACYSLTQYSVSQIRVKAPCPRSLTQWSCPRKPGISAKCHLLQSQPSAPRRHPEEVKPSTCIALRAYDFCPQSGTPGINFFLSFWRCGVLGWLAMFWGSDKGKEEERTATCRSCLCT